jgi:hypothetical protein
MSIMTVTTRITRQYLERKTKSDLAQMYLDLLDDDTRLEAAAKAVVEWEAEYRTLNHLGTKPPDCFIALAKLVRP